MNVETARSVLVLVPQAAYRATMVGRAVAAFLSRRPAAAGALVLLPEVERAAPTAGIGAVVGGQRAHIARSYADAGIPVFDPQGRRAEADAARLREVFAAMGWRIETLGCGPHPDPEVGAAARRLTEALAPHPVTGAAKGRPVEIFVGGRRDTLTHLATARARIADGARLVLVGDLSATEARAALLDEGLDATRTHVYVAEPALLPEGSAAEAIALEYMRAHGESPPAAFWDLVCALEAAAERCGIGSPGQAIAPPLLRLVLCDAHGPSRLDDIFAQPRAPLARDFAAVLAGRRLMMRASGTAEDHGRAAVGRWAAHHALSPESSVETCSLESMTRLYHLHGAPAPTVVYLHGGGMVHYDLDVFASFMTRLVAGCGRSVLALGYDKLPETPASVAIDGLMARLARHAPAGPDLAIAGDSIGGLLALYAVTRVLPGLFSRLVLIYPVLSVAETYPSYEAYGEGHLLDAAAMRWFRALAAPTFAARGFDPMRLAPAALTSARVTIVSAGCDILADEAVAFAVAHPTVVRAHFPDMPHDFCLHAGKLASARAAVEQIVDFLT